MADNIPDEVYWDDHNQGFYDGNNKSMGGKFFDQWKERRGEFPARALIKRRTAEKGKPSEPVVVMIPKGVHEGTSTPHPDNPILSVANRRKQSYDAHIAVGFDRAEALELCKYDGDK